MASVLKLSVAYVMAGQFKSVNKKRKKRSLVFINGFKCPFCQKGFNRKYRLKVNNHRH